MSGFRPFVRQLGFQPGVQLNPLRDQTDGAALDNSDQIVAGMARLTRGRIDRPFVVNKTNFLAKTGPAEAIRVNALNESKLQFYEALDAGAYQAVIMRMTPAAAAKSYAVANFSGTPTDTATTVAYSVSSTVPTAGYSLYVLDHECHNAGIKLALHADATPLTGTQVAASLITLRVLDAAGVVRYEYSGSLDPNSKDDFGVSNYLPDVVAQSTDNIEVVVAANATIPVTSNAYGRSITGKDQWATSGVLACFSEGGTIYVSTDYDRFINGLRDTRDSYGYLISGGTQVTSLIGKLADLAIEINVPLKLDIPGTGSASDALNFDAALNLDSHYIHKLWAPLAAEDPLNGGSVVWGTGGLQAGMSCQRNAQINAKGFAPKNYPIAGKEWPLSRTAVRQRVQPQEQDLSDLARAQINPVIAETYNGGRRFVFTDCLTSAKTVVSYKKLQTVAEMSLTLDNWVTLYAKELLMLPMSEFIKKMTSFLDTLLLDAQYSGWLVPAKNLEGNAAFSFTVQASSVRPADLVLIDYWTSYDGVARQVIVQQTLVK